MHSKPHPRAGKTVAVSFRGSTRSVSFRLEDWHDRVFGKSWQDAPVDVVERDYSFRVSADYLPRDNEVVYGMLSGSRYIVHATELVG
jgi:hypothetical protein